MNHIHEHQKEEAEKYLDYISETQGVDAVIQVKAGMNSMTETMLLLQGMLPAFEHEICGMIRTYLLPYYDHRAQCLKLDEIQPMMDALLESSTAQALKDEAAKIEGVDAAHYDNPSYDKYRDLTSDYFKPVLTNLECLCYIMHENDKRQGVDFDKEDTEEAFDEEEYENETEFIELYGTDPEAAFEKYPQFLFLKDQLNWSKLAEQFADLDVEDKE